jgi:NAD(P)-dependent dehydrogenase (short-subunit alcohol dehydrogenase family)
MQQQFSLVGKNAVVTGGSGVLGSAMAKGLATAGARVVLLGRNHNQLLKIEHEIKQLGGSAISVCADVLNQDALIQACDVIQHSVGSIDILVNAAGGNQKGATITPDQSFFDINDSALQKVIDLNIMGSILPCKIFGKSMAEQSSGCIVNISSMAAYRPLTRVGGYAASKAAINNFTQWLSVELALKYNGRIRVNAIAPGFFITEQNSDLLIQTDGTLTERGKKIIEHTPFKRFGKPEELVGTLVWLCSDASQFVTGAIIPVDGGFNAYSGV